MVSNYTYLITKFIFAVHGPVFMAPEYLFRLYDPFSRYGHFFGITKFMNNNKRTTFYAKKVIKAVLFIYKIIFMRLLFWK